MVLEGEDWYSHIQMRRWVLTAVSQGWQRPRVQTLSTTCQLPWVLGMEGWYCPVDGAQMTNSERPREREKEGKGSVRRREREREDKVGLGAGAGTGGEASGAEVGDSRCLPAAVNLQDRCC